MSVLTPLAGFAGDINSQCGEDGIIAEVLRRIDRQRPEHWAVEFGAWDGRHLSNTAALIDRGYRAVMIEPEPRRYRELVANYPGDQVIKLQRKISLTGADTLDAVLSETPIPADFDVLSIDIDGADYHVLASMHEYRPDVIVVEYNNSIPNEVHYVQEADLGVRRGASAAALYALASEMGYRAVAITEYNLILVEDRLAGRVLGDARPALAELRDDSAARNFLFFGYDGTLMTSQPVVVPWHRRLPVPPAAMQVLPRYLRRFPSDMSTLQLLVLSGLVAWRDKSRVVPALRAHGLRALQINNCGAGGSDPR